ncbi:acid phosphatase type 7-like [Hyposmocoma kahamanoa]|uniref:acid phosphatase type 7-like n=1 Tax=Hyposmocoma kahamanoa TaxID=1477025 RepID=UPI000E6D78EC|nr:acid phosphatase type 7-like [Hyposmocoma kahamanoa]
MIYLITLISLIVIEVYQTNVIGVETEYECSYCQPEQIHIAFGEKINHIVVTWTTMNDSRESLVNFGVFPDLDQMAEGVRTRYKNLHGQWIHRVTLKHLQFNTIYNYRCGSRYAWSDQFHYTTVPKIKKKLSGAIYGDMGVENAQAIPYLEQEAENNSIRFILHLGDFAYNMQDEDSRRGDEFMRQIQPFATTVPFMVCPGNHDQNKNFTQYKSRMTMPKYQLWESMFYSWNIGRIHFVSINTEAYFFLGLGKYTLVNQFRWLVKDLKRANSKKNRKKRPWIIMYGHHPMYCSGMNFKSKNQCYNVPTRVGGDLPGFKDNFAIEPLLMKYGVDIAIWAHQHSYERSWPVYDNKVYNGSVKQPYVNPRAPIHIITGAAGTKQGIDPFTPLKPSWCASRSGDYSYTLLHAHNKTHIHFEQISTNLRGTVIDEFWVVQKHHGSFYSS